MNKQIRFYCLLAFILGIVSITAWKVCFDNISGAEPEESLPAYVYPEHESAVKIPGSYRALSLLTAARAYPKADIPANGLYSAFATNQQALQKRSSLVASVSPWTTMGPLNQSGRTLAIAFNPQNPNTMYAGSASGGLWRSYSGGRGVNAWHRIETGFPALSVSNIAVVPEDSNTVYIATGEVYNANLVGEGAASRSLRGFYGIGILKTTDGGQNWSASLDWTNQQQRGVWAVRLDPQNSDIVWAGTTDGTYKSTDAGGSWEKVHDVIMVMDLAIHPANSNVVVAGCGNFASAGHGVYYTLDGGDTWTKANQGLPATFRGKIQFDVIQERSGAIFYASIGNGFGSSDGATWLATSEDDGRTWRTVSTLDYSQWQGWFAHDVAVNPENRNEVITVGIRAYRSTDGGSSFVQESGSGGFGGQLPPGAPEGNANYMHVDIHDVKYHPTERNIIYYGCDGGIFRSTDSGRTFTSSNGGYQTTQFYPGFSTSVIDSNLSLGGLQDNGSPLYLGTTAWSRFIMGGDGAWSALDPVNSNIMYASYQGLSLGKSVNRGGSFFDIEPPSSGITSFIAPFVLAPSNHLTLYAGRSIIYKSTNGGLEWDAAGSTLDGNPPIAMAISSRNSDIVYVATAPRSTGNRSGVFRTTDGGASWTDITGNLPDRFPSDLAVDPNDDATAYITFSGFGSSHIFKTHDYGATWGDIQGSLPDIPTLSVIIDPLFPEHIYVGNDIGVFFSANGGGTWEDFSEGLPEAIMAMDLKISPLNRKLRVATHGNGAYQRNLVGATIGITGDGIITADDFELEQNYPNPFNPETTISFSLNKRAQVSLRIYNSLGQEIKTLLDQTDRSTGKHWIAWDGRDNGGLRAASGMYFYRLYVGNYVSTKRMILTR